MARDANMPIKNSSKCADKIIKFCAFFLEGLKKAYVCVDQILDYSISLAGN